MVLSISNDYLTDLHVALEQESALVTATFKLPFQRGVKVRDPPDLRYSLIKKLNFIFALKTLAETAAEIENRPCYPA